MEKAYHYSCFDSKLFCHLMHKELKHKLSDLLKIMCDYHCSQKHDTA
jgi:hypothetical protein